MRHRSVIERPLRGDGGVIGDMQFEIGIFRHPLRGTGPRMPRYRAVLNDVRMLAGRDRTGWLANKPPTGFRNSLLPEKNSLIRI